MSRDHDSGDLLPERSTPSPRKVAMDLLARREHSRLELVRKLKRRFSAIEQRDAVRAAVEGLAEEGLQSDERFALGFARQRLYRGQGPRRIRAELQQRGVEAALIEAALVAVPAEEGTDWPAQAALELTRRFGREPATDFRDRARRLRFLEQRGFDTQEIPRDLVHD